MQVIGWQPVCRLRALWYSGLWAFLLSVCFLSVQAVEISEFLSVNSSGLTDEDGATSDWIELYHAGPGALDLDGYHLSDESSNLSKWTFPTNVSIAADGYLVVFASGKDRRVGGQELHTNFKLSGNGESLFLVAPDGTNVISAFDPFPATVADFSFGAERTAVLVTPESSALLHVPVDGSDGLDWTGGTNVFDDSAWGVVSAGIGYEANVQGSLLDGRRASTNFVSQFSPSDILPGPGNTNFTLGSSSAISQGNGVAYAASGGGLSYETFNNGGAHWLDGTHWKQNVVGSWTFEVALTVDGSPSHASGSAAHGAQLWLGGGGDQEVLAVQHNGSSLGLNGETTPLEPAGSTTNNQAAGFQHYRIAYDAPANRFSIWKNGVLLSDRQPSVSARDADFFAVGDGQSSIRSGSVVFDWMRYDLTGAYVPVRS